MTKKFRMDVCDRRSALRKMSAACLGLSSAIISMRCAGRQNMPLNFVFFLVDDLGWTDTAGFGSEYYLTPNIDRLAERGMKFTGAYTACTVCSPTRASILTGMYPARLHLTDWIAGHNYPFAKLRVPDWTMHLPHERVTIAEALKEAGYAYQAASIGKWHLGGEEYYPETQGFDENIGGTHLGSPPGYFYPYVNGDRSIPTLTGGKEGEYLTDRLTDEALQFIETNRNTPFFLYMAHYSVHTPLDAKKEIMEANKRRLKPGLIQNNPVYASMVQSTDESVGRIMRKIEELGIEERTCFIFFSDNGGLSFPKQTVTSNLPLREGKGSVYEGGVRVPLIISLPGRIEEGSSCDVPVMSIDFFPTMLELAGVDCRRYAPDGMSLVPLLSQSGSIERKAIFWHYPHYHPGGASPYGAVRAGDYKLIEFYEDNRVELYDIAGDIGETKDLAAVMPEKAAELRTLLREWRRNINAQMPSPNPAHDPKRAGVFP